MWVPYTWLSHAYHSQLPPTFNYSSHYRLSPYKTFRQGNRQRDEIICPS